MRCLSFWFFIVFVCGKGGHALFGGGKKHQQQVSSEREAIDEEIEQLEALISLQQKRVKHLKTTRKSLAQQQEQQQKEQQQQQQQQKKEAPVLNTKVAAASSPLPLPLHATATAPPSIQHFLPRQVTTHTNLTLTDARLLLFKVKLPPRSRKDTNARDGSSKNKGKPSNMVQFVSTIDVAGTMHLFDEHGTLLLSFDLGHYARITAVAYEGTEIGFPCIVTAAEDGSVHVTTLEIMRGNMVIAGAAAFAKKTSAAAAAAAGAGTAAADEAEASQRNQQRVVVDNEELLRVSASTHSKFFVSPFSASLHGGVVAQDVANNVGEAAQGEVATSEKSAKLYATSLLVFVRTTTGGGGGASPPSVIKGHNILVGDSQGVLHNFDVAGEQRSQVTVAEKSASSNNNNYNNDAASALTFMIRTGQMLAIAAGRHVYLLALGRLVKLPQSCLASENIISLTFDNRFVPYLYVGLENGDVVVYNVKTKGVGGTKGAPETCSIVTIIPSSSPSKHKEQEAAVVSLISSTAVSVFHSYVLSSFACSLKVFNTTYGSRYELLGADEHEKDACKANIGGSGTQQESTGLWFDATPLPARVHNRGGGVGVGGFGLGALLAGGSTTSSSHPSAPKIWILKAWNTNDGATVTLSENFLPPPIFDEGFMGGMLEWIKGPLLAGAMGLFAIWKMFGSVNKNKRGLGGESRRGSSSSSFSSRFGGQQRSKGNPMSSSPYASSAMGDNRHVDATVSKASDKVARLEREVEKLSQRANISSLQQGSLEDDD